MSTGTNIIIAVILSGSISGCGTPEALIDSAELSRGHLVGLRTQSEGYLKDANRRVSTRLDLLRKENLRLGENEQKVAQERLIATAGAKKLVAADEEMRKMASELANKEATLEAALKAYEAKLAPIKQQVAFPAQSFKKAEEGVAQLAEEQSFADRAAFILAYARAVKTKYDEAKQKSKAQQSAAPAAAGQGQPQQP